MKRRILCLLPVLTGFSGGLATAQNGSAAKPAILRYNSPGKVGAGQTVTLSVVASATQPIFYQWSKNSSAILGATNSSYVIQSAKLSDVGNYSVLAYNSFGGASSGSNYLYVYDVPNVFVSPPATTVAAGVKLKLEVAAIGAQPMTFQWLFNGAPIAGGNMFGAIAPGEVLVTYEIASAQFSDSGVYSVRLTNFYGTTITPAIGLTVRSPPTISGPPMAQAVAQGSTTNFSVTANGTSPLAYQWLFNGNSIPGATSAALAVANVRAENVGSYSVTVSNILGSVTSAVAALSILSIPPAVTVQPTSKTVLAGQSTTFEVTAAGTAPLSYQWLKTGTRIQGATMAAYSISQAQLEDAGSYTCNVTNSAGTASSSPAVLAVLPTARMVNVSLLTSVGAPDSTFTLGFVVGGAGTVGSVPILIRAAGPSLGAFGVPGVLEDPRLELFAGPTKIVENDNWNGSQGLTSAFDAVGAFRFSSPISRDAAALVDVGTPDNSVRISAVGNGTGAVIAELYDMRSTSEYAIDNRRIINASVLKELSGGFTVGFVIGGIGARRVLFRAIGPSLATFGVATPASDPRIMLFSGGAKIGENEDWSGSPILSSTFADVGAFALNASSRDAALLVTLPPGSYTAQVSGANNQPGVVLVEVYEVP